MTLPHGGHIPEPYVFDPDSDEPPDVSDVTWDDSLVFITFWGLSFVVFLQFFTRYVLNDSYTWTEEIARYLLIWLTFFGLFMVVRKESNVAVEIFYRWFPMRLRRALSGIVDAVAMIYWGVTFGLAVATLYAIAVAARHWRTKSSPLIDVDTGAALQAPERPGMD
jgi:TRAP-type C4-dicarboxylate transport system permease small subunit